MIDRREAFGDAGTCCDGRVSNSEEARSAVEEATVNARWRTSTARAAVDLRDTDVRDIVNAAYVRHSAGTTSLQLRDQYKSAPNWSIAFPVIPQTLPLPISTPTSSPSINESTTESHQFNEAAS